MLVVDGDPLHRQTAAEMFADAGLHVETAACCQDALAALRDDGELACVLLDAGQTAEADGESARRLRQAPALRDVPFLAMVAHGLPEHRAAALSTGVEGWLDLPLDIDVALRVIAERVQAAREGSRSVTSEAIDRAAGLAACQGDAVLLASLSARFSEAHATAGARVRTAARRDPFAARSLAERLALDARHVGARATAVAAARLVAQLDRGAAADELDPELSTLEAALARDVAALRGALR